MHPEHSNGKLQVTRCDRRSGTTPRQGATGWVWRCDRALRPKPASGASSATGPTSRRARKCEENEPALSELPLGADPPPRAPANGRPISLPFGFSGCWRALAKGTAWAGFIMQFIIITPTASGGYPRCTLRMRCPDTAVFRLSPTLVALSLTHSAVRRLAVARRATQVFRSDRNHPGRG